MAHSHKHAGVRAIDAFAYASGLNGWNPTFKVVLSVGTILVCLAADCVPVSLAVILSMGALIVRRGGLPLHDYIGLLGVPLAFLLLSGAAVAVQITSGPTGDWNLVLPWFSVCVTRASLRFALGLTLKALGAVSAMYLLALSTPAGELTSVLRRAHLPGILVELMYLIYRFIFILLDTHARMKDAAESRLGDRDFRTACRSFGQTAGNLLLIALKKSGAYYDAMTARCYDGGLAFWEEEKPFRPVQAAAALAYWAALVVLALAVR